MSFNRKIDRFESGPNNPQAPNEEVVWVNTNDNTINRYNESTDQWVSVSGSGEGGSANIADFVFTNNEPENNSSTITLPGDKEMQISAGADSDLYLTAGDDLYITTSQDDVHVRAADDIRFTANFGTEEGQEYYWRMDSEGKLQLPGQGYIDNPSDSSGDGYGYDTLKLVPDAELEYNGQYLIIDPTAPNHIHIRAGGIQDYSNAELILGGERAGLHVNDSNGNVIIQSKKEDYNWSYQNINEVSGSAYIVGSEVAEPDFGDFIFVDDVKYVINYVSRNAELNTTQYTAISNSGTNLQFVSNQYYTFTRDNGNHQWSFDDVDSNPTLILPSEDPVIANLSAPGDITLSAYNGVKLSFASESGSAGLRFPDDTLQTTAYVGGATGSFVSQDGKTITVTNGIITDITGP